MSYASIRGQCARHKFYGDERVEIWLSNLEARHAAAYRAIIDVAWNKRSAVLSDEEDYFLREAILIQRSRTPSHARILASSTDQMMIHAYWEYLKTLPTTSERRATVEAIERGKVSLKNTQFASLMFSLQLSSRSVAAISDLALLLLRNQTAIPFLIGDTPCVFSNHYMRAIQRFGVLGQMTPGLMAVLPIDTRTQVLLYDSNVYTPDYSTAGCIDIFRTADVSLLNALQIHSAEENIYFSDVSVQTYVREILTAHRKILRNHQGGFVVHGPGDIMVDGAPNTGEVMHTFEPQLPITLDLSFMTTAILPPNENPNRPRDPALALRVEQALGRRSEPLPTRMDDFAKWMESLMFTSDGP